MLPCEFHIWTPPKIFDKDFKKKEKSILKALYGSLKRFCKVVLSNLQNSEKIKLDQF